MFFASGDYNWRVRALDGKGTVSAWNEPISFSVGKITPSQEPMPTPVPVAEAVAEEVPTAAEIPKPEVQKPVNDIKVEVSEIEKPKPTPEAKPKPKPKPKPEPEPLLAPVLEQLKNRRIKVTHPDEVESKIVTVVLNWNQVKRASSYRVEGELDGGKSRIDEMAMTNELELRLTENGTYHFRLFPIEKVKGKDGLAKEVVGPVSNTVKMLLKKYFALKSPTVENAPSSSIKIVNFGASEQKTAPTIFSWEKVKFASSYRIQFSPTTKFENIIAESVTKETTYLLDKQLPKGKNYWRMRSESETHKSQWTKPASFDIAE
jgi:hypothetical protein